MILIIQSVINSHKNLWILRIPFAGKHALVHLNEDLVSYLFEVFLSHGQNENVFLSDSPLYLCF